MPLCAPPANPLRLCRLSLPPARGRFCPQRMPASRILPRVRDVRRACTAIRLPRMRCSASRESIFRPNLRPCRSAVRGKRRPERRLLPARRQRFRRNVRCANRHPPAACVRGISRRNTLSRPRRSNVLPLLRRRERSPVLLLYHALSFTNVFANVAIYRQITAAVQNQ